MLFGEDPQRVDATARADATAVVNSHNGWAPLEEVIVGAPFHLDYQNDVSFRVFFFGNLRSGLNPNGRGPWVISADSELEKRVRAELEEDLAEFISLLEREDVAVRRPEIPSAAQEFRTPDWTSSSGHSVMPRDMLLVIGNEVIETAPMVRSRYLESNLYKRLLVEYFNRGAKWTVAPRSRLLEENFDFGYVRGEGYDDPLPEEPFYEIMFDGAQVLRLGRDLLFNCSTENHRMGMRWLQRQLGDDYRVHEINITDHHADARMLPLRPGTLLLHREIEEHLLPPFLRDWEIVRYAPPEEDLEPGTYGGRPILASPGLGMNVLSLDEERVVVQDSQAALIRDLDKAGFSPIPCSWRHGRIVGGGFHCMTLDVRRRGGLEDYFSG
ncbi:glycine amidinotransferase [Rubrobacter tropicus]|uniref:Glycine amidinotransferase n=1 Tax=Rubrobacter tropicus TaxID=2653851 RepID=A0A6G8QDZ8_9ACTN|nr:glycine amidinotransferase [Rubrobacter tropicus]QIN84658.1 glycine amidinotransferase [Rubrobacter tropicus]